MSQSAYSTKLLEVLSNLESDYANDKITKRELEILLGLLIEKEFSDNIKHQIYHVLPKPRKKNRGFSFMNYEWRHSHAR